MIEPTDEMVQAFARVFFTNPLGEDVRAGLAAVLALVDRDTVGPLRDLLAQLVDEDPCWLDHHGYCQAHSLHSPPCPHQVAKELLGGTS